MDFLIITGMSGAGKSQAANTIEDLGWYTIDNMPAQLIPKVAEIYTSSPGNHDKIAFVVDIRGELEFDSLLRRLDEMKRQNINCRTVFLDCADDTIISRYKFTRRTHPLVTGGISMTEALKREREMLEPAKLYADYIIDTTKLSTAQLKTKISEIVKIDSKHDMLVTCMSFGFKHGAATEADLVFDVRCFPNPYYIEELRELTGLDKPVSDYVLSHKETTVFLDKLYDMIDYLLPMYVKEGKAQLIIAIGCTGGKHRSVTIAEKLSAHIRNIGYRTVIIHRDITK